SAARDQERKFSRVRLTICQAASGKEGGSIMARIDRREFILKGPAAAAGWAGLGLPEDVLAQQTGRKLGTCGPPPQKSPQRQTSAEGMPPLPLPAVPLRRSEPKAEPTPPLMIAK